MYARRARGSSHSTTNQDTFSKYVEFQGGTVGVACAGYRTHILPATIPAGSITGLQVKANYQGPGTGTQTWTWKLYDNWSSSNWVTIGDNRHAPDWAKWAVLTFTVAGPYASYVQSGTGAIRVELVSNNAADNADIDWENVIVTWSGALPAPVACSGGPCYAPPPTTAWQWQLSNVKLSDSDLFDNSGTVVSQLHQAGQWCTATWTLAAGSGSAKTPASSRRTYSATSTRATRMSGGWTSAAST